MNRLSFWLVCLFGALSVLFGAYAAWRYYKPKARMEPHDVYWGADLLEKARMSNKLIFFTIEGRDFPEFSDEAKAILNKFYICATLSPKKYFADNLVLSNIFKNSGSEGKFSLGILSPQGRPLFLASDFSRDKNSPFYDAACLMGAVNAYEKYKGDLLLKRQISSSFIIKLSEFPNLFLSRSADSSFANMNMFLRRKDWKDATALLSENARLAARLANFSPTALEVATSAYGSILSEIKNEDRFSSKLLLARALSEYALLMIVPSAKHNFLKVADDILKNQKSDGLFYEKSAATLLDNALAMSIMARAYKISGDEKYKNAAVKNSYAIRLILGRKNTPPGILNSLENPDENTSEANGLACALLVRGWIDAYFATGEEKYLGFATSMFKKFDKMFSDKSEGNWYVNMPCSILASSYRLKNFSDDLYPSGNGEGAQILSDFCYLKGIHRHHLIDASSPFNTPFAVRFFDRAGLKLSLLDNPMRK